MGSLLIQGVKMTEHNIIPHLWFDKETVETAELYTSIFPDSKITHKSIIKNTPSGDCDIAGFKLEWPSIYVKHCRSASQNQSVNFFLSDVIHAKKWIHILNNFLPVERP